MRLAVAGVLSVACVCMLSLCAMAGYLDLSRSPLPVVLSQDALSRAEHELAEVRKTMGTIEARAQKEHSLAAMNARYAAKDRDLEKRLNSFALQRQQRGKEEQANIKDIQAKVEALHTDIHSLKKSIHRATVSIKDLSLSMQKDIASRPLLHKEATDVTHRLLQLSNEQAYLQEEANVLSVAAAPHNKAYARDSSDLKSMELHIQQLKAQAQLYNAQASVIADNLHHKLLKLKADQKETQELQVQSNQLPPESSVKLHTPKFVSLAAKAKAIYTKAGSMINQVQKDDQVALAEKMRLLTLERQIAAVDQKAASIDLAAAKLSEGTAQQDFLAEHLDDDAKSAKKQLASTLATIKALKAKKRILAKDSKGSPAAVKQAKKQLKIEENALLKAQTSIDTDKAEVVQLRQTIKDDKKSLAQDVDGAAHDLKLAVGAAAAARVHEKKSSKFAKKAAVDDKRVDKLTAELAVSDRKVNRARQLDQSAAKATQDLNKIETSD